MTTLACSGLTDADIAQVESYGLQWQRGKVCDIISNAEEMLLIYSDRLSAFDRHVGLVAGKGIASASLSAFWFAQLSDIAHHFCERVHPRVIRVRKTEPIKIEVIVRGYLAGSMARAYQQGERRFCGIELAAGLSAHTQLPTPIITPTTKEDEHDRNLSAPQLIALELCTAAEWQQIAATALQLYQLGSACYRQHGYLLVDTKYEFGRVGNKILLIDELHSQDSSRLWLADSYAQRLQAGLAPQAVDKDIARRWLLEHGQDQTVPPAVLAQLGQAYRQLAAQLTEVSDDDQPLDHKLCELLL